MHTHPSLTKLKSDFSCMPTLNNLETSNSSSLNPQLSKKEELWDSKASSLKVPVRADSVEEIAEASEVVIVEVSEAAIVEDSEAAIVEVSEAAIVEDSEAATVGVPVEDSVVSEPAIN